METNGLRIDPWTPCRLLKSSLQGGVFGRFGPNGGDIGGAASNADRAEDADYAEFFPLGEG